MSRVKIKCLALRLCTQNMNGSFLSEMCFLFCLFTHFVCERVYIKWHDKSCVCVRHCSVHVAHCGKQTQTTLTLEFLGCYQCEFFQNFCVMLTSVELFTRSYHAVSVTLTYFEGHSDAWKLKTWNLYFGPYFKVTGLVERTNKYNYFI